MICPNCHAEIGEGKKFCGKCGTALTASPVAQTSVASVPSSLRCASCGSEVLSGKKFCGACGNPISAPQAQLPTAQPHTSRPTSSPGKIARPTPAFQTHTPMPIGTPPVLRRAPPGGTGAEIQRLPMKLPSATVLASIAAGIFILSCVGGWYVWGVELDLTTDPGGANVILDGKPAGKTVGTGGSLTLPHITHGMHTLTLTHPGFDKWSQPVALGWFHVSRPLSIRLPVPTFPLTVSTNPGGAKVRMDGKDVGVSDPFGNLVVQNVPRGGHAVTITLVGYRSWSNSLWIQAPFTVRVNLVSAQVQEKEQEQPSVQRQQNGDYALNLSDAQNSAVENFLSRNPTMQLVTSNLSLTPEGRESMQRQVSALIASGQMQHPFASWHDFNGDDRLDVALVFISKSIINSFKWHEWWIVVFQGTPSGGYDPNVVTKFKGGCLDGLTYHEDRKIVQFSCFGVAMGSFHWNGQAYDVQPMLGD
jgi:hypothetical protein